MFMKCLEHVYSFIIIINIQHVSQLGHIYWLTEMNDNCGKRVIKWSLTIQGNLK